MKILSFNKSKIVAGCLLIVIGTMFSCKKLIEIPAKPPSQITRAEQFADSASTISAVAGVYTYNNGQGFAYSDGYLTTTTGSSADELSTTLTYSGQQDFYNYSLTAINSQVGSLWKAPYIGMYQVNDVLDGVTNNSSLSASFVKQITGEMKVVRALYYFNLVNLFGGVPLVTSPDYNTTALLPKASTSAVYTQILTDLADARQKLPASYPSAGRARPNLYTVIALQAKVHLYQSNWRAAYNEADSVIKSGIYSLTASVNDVFLDGSTEAIWQIPAVGSYSQTAEANTFVPFFSLIAPDFLVGPFLMQALASEPGDQRLQSWVATSVLNGNTLNYPYKYKNRNAGDTPAEGYMVFRLGEMYLIRAEAALKLNDLNGALADVNVIRKRAGLGASTLNASSPPAEVLKAVMLERQRELCFEWGNRWFDLKRNGTAGTVLSAEKTGWQTNAQLYPIPLSQLQLNSNLIQNPGY